jgi:hypothetical protein
LRSSCHSSTGLAVNQLFGAFFGFFIVGGEDRDAVCYVAVKAIAIVPSERAKELIPDAGERWMPPTPHHRHMPAALQRRLAKFENGS